MSVTSVTQAPTGLVGVDPNVIEITTTDTYATVVTTGYLNNYKQNGSLNVFNNKQMALVYTTDDGPVWLKVVVSGGNISLAAPSVPGQTTLPTVANNLIISTDTDGTLADSGLAVSNVVSKIAANTFTGSGQITLAKANGTEAANAVTASGNAGVITTSALTTAGGGTYAITWTNTKITATSVISLCVQGGTNTVQSIAFTCVPGAGTATLTIHNLTAATALNGTILIGYAVL